jgi:hypothetical protein
MNRQLLVALLFSVTSATVVRAQAFDASIPDASVGQGGPNQTSEENDPNAYPCLDSSLCEKGYLCRNGHCVPPGKSSSSSGCSTTVVPLSLLGVLALLRRARRGH